MISDENNGIGVDRSANIQRQSLDWDNNSGEEWH